MTNQDYDSTDEEAHQALRNIFWQTVRKGGSPEKLLKEFDSVLSQIFQPTGGSENFTNIRSPGMHPAKIPAVPGDSGRNVASPHRLNEENHQSLDVRGEYSQADPNKRQPEEYVGSTTQHPAYGSGRRNIRGPGYEPYKEQRGVLGKGLEQWEKERGTQASINPGTTPLLTEEDLRGEDEEETPADIADKIRGKTDEGAMGAVMGSDQEFEAQVARRETQKPCLVRRDQKGVGSKDTRKHYHTTYTGEQ